MILPTLNAILNGSATVILLLGWLAAKAKKPRHHMACMIAATVISAAFLVSYITYHFSAPMSPYEGSGVLRWTYYTILITHVPLATVMVPFIIRAIWLAIAGRIEDHRKLVKWVFPVWLYVSVTGVIIYWFLYVHQPLGS